MTEQNKQLLLKDLCARVPYDVVIHTYYNKPIDIKCTGCDLFANTVNLDIPNDDEAKVYIENVRPYLRPTLSMTEEECRELGELITIYDMVDYMLAHHFDVHNLIEKGLALEAPEGMYKTE